MKIVDMLKLERCFSRWILSTLEQTLRAAVVSSSLLITNMTNMSLSSPSSYLALGPLSCPPQRVFNRIVRCASSQLSAPVRCTMRIGVSVMPTFRAVMPTSMPISTDDIVEQCDPATALNSISISSRRTSMLNTRPGQLRSSPTGRQPR